jgi:hypothetical protein
MNLQLDNKLVLVRIDGGWCAAFFEREVIYLETFYHGNLRQ